MQRELTLQTRGELYHLRFHNYMGPWEGHQIEHLLELDEVEPPQDGSSYQEVLGPNQCYLWHEMAFDPDLHALVTADRLTLVAQIVRDRDVVVLEGTELLPPPPDEHVHLDPPSDVLEDSYVVRLEERHRSPWTQGPRVFVRAALARLAIVAAIVLVVVVGGRHASDPYHEVGLAEFFDRAAQPVVEQNFLARLFSPNDSHLVRHEIRSVRYASGNRMILGDGYYLAFDGAIDVMPWLRQASTSQSALVVEATARDGRVTINRVTCGGTVLDRSLVLRKIGRLASSDAPPRRDESRRDGGFGSIESLDVGRDAEVFDLEGQMITIKGRLRREHGTLVLRCENGAGVALDTSNMPPKLGEFLELFTGEPGPIEVDLVVTSVYPWTAGAGEPQRRGTVLLGSGVAVSASAQNHHVLGRRPS